METRDVQCAGCGKICTVMEPADDSWEAITAHDPSLPGKQMKVTGYRIIVRCPDPDCGTRTVIQREDNPQ